MDLGPIQVDDCTVVPNQFKIQPFYGRGIRDREIRSEIISDVPGLDYSRFIIVTETQFGSTT